VTNLDEGTSAGYSIGVVTRRTGLSPDVLRVWERRYGVVTPTRSSGGQRLYSAADVEKLRLLRRLVDGGHRIASIARLDADALTALSREIEVAPPAASDVSSSAQTVELLVDATARLDSAGIEAALRRSALSLGAEAWVDTIVAPFLEQVGDRWHEGTITPAHEHLATTTVREVLAWVVKSFGVEADAPSILVATPAGELHELGAMMASVIAAGAGWRVHYLGANVPAANMVEAARQLDVSAIALSLVHPDHAAGSITEVKQLRRALPATTAIIVGGKAARGIASDLVRAGAKVATDTKAFRSELADITPAD
jgi:DNA-binding transcriptional MerR regulator/methylmalonyl-CoA mutase cobalamin-binding subunit